MIRMSEEDSEHQIIKQLQELNLLSALCQWDWMKGGIKFNSIYLILLVEPTELTTLKLWEFKSTPTAESEESTSLTGCIPRKSYPQSSNCSCLCKKHSDDICIYDNLIFISKGGGEVLRGKEGKGSGIGKKQEIGMEMENKYVTE